MMMDWILNCMIMTTMNQNSKMVKPSGHKFKQLITYARRAVYERLKIIFDTHIIIYKDRE